MNDLKRMSELTGIDPRTLSAYARQGRFKAQLIGRMWFVEEDEILRFAAEHKAQLTPPDGFESCDEKPSRSARCVIREIRTGKTFEWDGRVKYGR